MQSQVARRRWWIHLILVGGYFFPGKVFALTHIRTHPALTSTSAGLMRICGIQIFAFGFGFALGWLASRVGLDDLYFRRRPSWWVVPLGSAYSVFAHRFFDATTFALLPFALRTLQQLQPAAQ